MPDPDIYEFVDNLWKDKVYTLKQLTYIENIYTYIKDLRVYKVALAVYPRELKKAKKCGLTKLYMEFIRDFGKIQSPVPGAEHGKYIISYSPYKRLAELHEGETEEIVGLPRKRKNILNINNDENIPKTDDDKNITKVHDGKTYVPLA